jgi:hypothetical protein
MLPGANAYSVDVPYRFERAPQAADYVRSLTAPFFAPPPKLGVGTFVPTSKHAIWRELATVAPRSTDTGFVAVLTSAPTSMVRVYTFANPNLAISDPANNAQAYNAANSANFQAQAQTARVINGAMRGKVRYTSTNLPGIFGALQVPLESIDNLAALSPNNLIQMSGWRTASSCAAGWNEVEVQYRPVDQNDFQFKNAFASVISTSSAVSLHIIIGLGFTATNWDAELTSVFHMETLGGLDASGDEDAEPSLVDGGATIDSLGAAVQSTGEPILTSSNIIQALDGVVNAVSRARGRYPTALTIGAEPMLGRAGSAPVFIDHRANDGSAAGPSVSPVGRLGLGILTRPN